MLKCVHAGGHFNECVAECCLYIQICIYTAAARGLNVPPECYFLISAACCSVLQSVVECCSVLQSAVACCSVLQRAAACCSVLQRVAACCSWQSCLLKAKVTRYIHLSYLSRIYIHICIIHTISRYMHIHIIQIHMCVSVYKNTSYVTYEGIMPHLYEPCHTAL